jgi:UDP-N-acetylmuramoyl-tripeptide--D-alanyl-D-alanine ligase
MDLSMSNLTAEQAETCTAGMLFHGSRETEISGISIDTRTMHSGDLFIAIRGPNNDGHQFVDAALQKGAVGAVVDYAYGIPRGFPANRLLLVVKDTHRALMDIAAEARRQWRGSLVAITGSMGKTTTKEFATHVLQSEYSVYKSQANYNNLFGLPLSIYGLTPDDHIGIFEMGMSAPGEIEEMCRIAAPSVGVITNIAPVHLAFFKSVEEIAQAKGELADSLPHDGTLIYNADDPRVRAIAARFKGEKISFGLAEDADVRAIGIEVVGLQETRFRIVSGGIERKAMIPLAGAHYVWNALPAIALGRHYRMQFEQVVESLRYLHQASMRGQVLAFKDGFSVIDDSYNSNPQALIQVIDTFAHVPDFERRILVAGEMLELGEASEALHHECGVWAAKCGVDIIVAVRGAARQLAQGAVAGGMPEAHVHFFTEVDPATDFVSREVRNGDLVLVKGSRGVHLEKMIKALRQHHMGQSD